MNYLIYFICLFLSSQIFAQQQSTNPGVFPGGSATYTQSLIKCPKITISNQTLNRNATPIKLSATCSNIGSGSGGAWAGTYIGVAVIPSCPSTAPYLGGFLETWSGAFVAGAVVLTNVLCCTTPQPPMSFTSGETEWQEGTICP